MTTRQGLLTDQVAAVRATFDESFSRPIAQGAGDRIGFVAFRIGESRFALRSSEIAGVVERPRLVSVPTGASELPYLAGVRGTVVAACQLAAMLGLEAPRGAPTFLALSAREPSVAFAFNEFEGYVEVEPGQLHPTDAGAFVREGFPSEGALRYVVDVATLLDRIRDRSQAGRG